MKEASKRVVECFEVGSELQDSEKVDMASSSAEIQRGTDQLCWRQAGTAGSL